MYLGRNQLKASASWFVDENFRMFNVEHVIEEGEVREVHSHRTFLRTADTSSVLDVSRSYRIVDVLKALGRFADRSRKRT